MPSHCILASIIPVKKSVVSLFTDSLVVFIFFPLTALKKFFLSFGALCFWWFSLYLSHFKLKVVNEPVTWCVSHYLLKRCFFLVLSYFFLDSPFTCLRTFHPSHMSLMLIYVFLLSFCSPCLGISTDLSFNSPIFSSPVANMLLNHSSEFIMSVHFLFSEFPFDYSFFMYISVFW